jgi:hypothetical protein
MTEALPIYTELGTSDQGQERAVRHGRPQAGALAGTLTAGEKRRARLPCHHHGSFLKITNQCHPESMSSSRQTDALGRVHKTLPICSSPTPARYSQFAHNPQHLVLTSSTRSRTIAPTHDDCQMPGAHLHMSSTATALTCLPEPDHVFLRLQLLARLTLSLRQHYHIRCTSHGNA